MKKDEKREVRKVDQFEIREVKTEDKKKVIIEGYFAKFNKPTELWEGFIEMIAPTAFDETISDGHNIFMLYHHDWHKPLASTKTGLLELEVDYIGLRFKATINSSLSYVKDVIELINDELIQGCSFGFECLDEENIYDRRNDINTRTLKKIRLFEGSILCIPAYEDTTVFTRAKQILEEKKNEPKDEKIELEELREWSKSNNLILEANENKYKDEKTELKELREWSKSNEKKNEPKDEETELEELRGKLKELNEEIKNY